MVVAHTGREDARVVAARVCRALADHGLGVRLLADEAAELALDLPDLDVAEAGPAASAGCEIVVVVGGDGTILRAAEMTRASGTPLLGVNLGHVGFLAEAEHDDVEFTIDAVVAQQYSSDERLTLEVRVFRDGEVVVRPVGNVSVTFDHRVVDGARAAAFCLDVIGRLQAAGPGAGT